MSSSNVHAKLEVETMDRSVGKRLNIVRTQNGIKQQTFAAFIGVSSQQVAKYEKRQNRITAGALCKIAKSLDMPVSLFLPQDTAAQNLEAIGKVETEFILFLRQIPNYKQSRLLEILRFYAEGDMLSRMDVNDNQLELMILSKL